MYKGLKSLVGSSDQSRLCEASEWHNLRDHCKFWLSGRVYINELGIHRVHPNSWHYDKYFTSPNIIINAGVSVSMWNSEVGENTTWVVDIPVVNPIQPNGYVYLYIPYLTTTYARYGIN